MCYNSNIIGYRVLLYSIYFISISQFQLFKEASLVLAAYCSNPCSDYRSPTEEGGWTERMERALQSLSNILAEFKYSRQKALNTVTGNSESKLKASFIQGGQSY